MGEEGLGIGIVPPSSSLWAAPTPLWASRRAGVCAVRDDIPITLHQTLMCASVSAHYVQRPTALCTEVNAYVRMLDPGWRDASPPCSALASATRTRTDNERARGCDRPGARDGSTLQAPPKRLQQRPRQTLTALRTLWDPEQERAGDHRCAKLVIPLTCRSGVVSAERWQGRAVALHPYGGSPGSRSVHAPGSRPSRRPAPSRR